MEPTEHTYCEGCPLLKKSRKGTTLPGNYVGSAGDIQTCKYVLVGEAPARDEVWKKTPFVGVTGRLFRKLIAKVGISEDDCYITNAIKCMIPPRLKGQEKQKILAKAIAHCHRQIIAELLETPKGVPIALMGRGARDSVLPEKSKGGVLASRGWYKWRDGRDLLVTVHPSYINYNPGNAPMFLKDMQRIKRGGPQKPPTVEYELLKTHKDLENFIQFLEKVVGPKGEEMEEGLFLAFDLETDQIDYNRDRILCMSVSYALGKAVIIPDSLLYVDGKEFVTTGATKEHVKAFLDSFRYEVGLAHGVPNSTTVELLDRMFRVPGLRWVGHNAKFDVRFLKGQLGSVEARIDFDTIVAHYALDERRGGHSLKPLADDYYDTGDYEVGLKQYIFSRDGRYSMIPRKVLYQYNAMDTELTRRFAIRFERDLKRQGLYQQPFQFPLMEGLQMLLDVELYGINIDWDELDRFCEEEVFPELDVLGARLRVLCEDPEFNPLSSQQCIRLLYDKFKFPIVEFRQRAAGKKVKKRTSEKGAIMAWEVLWDAGTLPVTALAWEFASTLKLFRHVNKMQSTYMKNWRSNKAPDNRVHPTFQLRGTVTGRLSVVDPPVQTIPSKVRDRWAVGIANIHIPTPGWTLVYADYSMAELRILADLSQDAAMIAAFAHGEGDFHALAAELAHGPEYTRDQRQDCKRITYGWAYGGNVEEICTQALHFPPKAAKYIATNWNETFKDAQRFREEQEDLMVSRGYVESMLGRRRRTPLITRENRGKVGRIAYNSPIQAAASDLVLVSAIRLHARYKDSGYAHVILMIHDSLILEARNDHVEEVKQALNSTLLEVAHEYFPAVPHIAEVKAGLRLGDVM